MKEKVIRTNAELFMSSVCNLACSYCFIGKNSALSVVDQRIKKEFEEKRIINMLKGAYEKGMDRLSLWGAEPTINMEYLTKDIEEILLYFPKLSSIDFSSNFYAQQGVDKIIELIKAININLEEDRNFEVSIQISIDGPPSINDCSRVTPAGEGSSKSIEKNVERFLDMLSGLELKKALKIKQNFKSTVSSAYIKQMADDDDALFEYCRYFDRFGEIFDRQKTKNLQWSVLSASPTIVIPGDYSVEDGRSYAQFIRKMRVLAVKDHKEKIFKYFRVYRAVPYLGRLREVVFDQNELRKQNRGLSCGASSFGFALGIDGDCHLCHRSYLYEQPEYVSLVTKGKDHYEKGRLKLFTNKFINKIDDPINFARQHYVANCYKDFSYLAMAYVYNAIKQLAVAGQTDKAYLEDEELVKISAAFIRKTCSCMLENVLMTGSFHLVPLQLIKLWVNGALQELITTYKVFKEEGIIL